MNFNLSKNIKAFLDMIAVSEGTAGKGNDGYNVIVGGELFTRYAQHPNKLIDLPRLKIKSSAAGRYQILYRYWVYYSKLLSLKDFSPASQDAVAIQMIKERRALDDIEAGRFEAAVNKCKNIWASLPGAGYGQHENDISKLKIAYRNAGGTIKA